MQSAFDEFSRNLARVRHIHGLHAGLEATLTTAVDLSDILRSEIVMVVSALDRYVHDLARLGMAECFAGARPRTEAFNRFSISMATSALLVTPSSASIAFEAEIRARHSHLSFQHPDKIADAIRLFSEVKLWENVGAALGLDARDTRNTLGLIADRRNKIAHESDVDPSYPGLLWSIDRLMVERMIDDIERIVLAIHQVCA